MKKIHQVKVSINSHMTGIEDQCNFSDAIFTKYFTDLPSLDQVLQAFSKEGKVLSGGDKLAQELCVSALTHYFSDAGCLERLQSVPEDEFKTFVAEEKGVHFYYAISDVYEV
jgi:hypothetical protein